MLFSYFSGKKAVRKIQVNTEFKDLKQVHPVKVSDEHDLFREETPACSVLSSLHRFKGRIPTCSHNTGVTEISESGNQSRGSGVILSVQGSAVRSLCFSEDLHEDHSRGFGTIQVGRGICSTISGRPSLVHQLGESFTQGSEMGTEPFRVWVGF